MKKTYILMGVLMAVISVFLLLKPSNSIKEKIGNKLSEEIIKNKSDDLKKDNDIYYFKGKAKNNYIFLNDNMWRILSINKDNSIKLIKDSKISSLDSTTYTKKESFEYKDSIIKELLEEWYKEELSSKNDIILDKQYCSSYKDKCLTTIKAKIGLLNEEEYNNTFIENESFLTESFDWWIISNNYYDEEHDDYLTSYIGEDGTIIELSVYEYSGIRPVINIAGDTLVTGKGTEAEPYTIN